MSGAIGGAAGSGVGLAGRPRAGHGREMAGRVRKCATPADRVGNVAQDGERVGIARADARRSTGSVVRFEVGRGASCCSRSRWASTTSSRSTSPGRRTSTRRTSSASGSTSRRCDAPFEPSGSRSRDRCEARDTLPAVFDRPPHVRGVKHDTYEACWKSGGEEDRGVVPRAQPRARFGQLLEDEPWPVLNSGHAKRPVTGDGGSRRPRSAAALTSGPGSSHIHPVTVVVPRGARCSSLCLAPRAWTPTSHVLVEASHCARSSLPGMLT